LVFLLAISAEMASRIKFEVPVSVRLEWDMKG
jgi:hypothetical protein